MSLLWTIPVVLTVFYIAICIRRANKAKPVQQGESL